MHNDPGIQGPGLPTRQTYDPVCAPHTRALRHFRQTRSPGSDHCRIRQFRRPSRPSPRGGFWCAVSARAPRPGETKTRGWVSGSSRFHRQARRSGPARSGPRARTTPDRPRRRLPRGRTPPPHRPAGARCSPGVRSITSFRMSSHLAFRSARPDKLRIAAASTTLVFCVDASRNTASTRARGIRRTTRTPRNTYGWPGFDAPPPGTIRGTDHSFACRLLARSLATDTHAARHPIRRNAPHMRPTVAVAVTVQRSPWRRTRPDPP